MRQYSKDRSTPNPEIHYKGLPWSSLSDGLRSQDYSPDQIINLYI